MHPNFIAKVNKLTCPTHDNMRCHSFMSGNARDMFVVTYMAMINGRVVYEAM
jgi:hypothetical protein